eukprot:gnl/MRDRNA2_/MRDRNA2_96747_c0_seq1.p1 gnl/MRDRNA2_/MRDRNA2_96747_c0~~gnl/MRDRNA2_/MRDRNA2_96747_c0_seq1.p1  ORF type:complete len:181 (+),score=54.39 gnl/MRDRNA2_/MRDRNA2_96747_c0_seq1:89-631(+)
MWRAIVVAICFENVAAHTEQVHSHLRAAGMNEDANSCVEDFKGATFDDRCDAALNYMNTQYAVLVNATTVQAKQVPEEPTKCEKIEKELAKLEEMKKKCDKPNGDLKAGGWPDDMKVKSEGRGDTCWKDLKYHLPKYIEHYKKLHKENKCDEEKPKPEPAAPKSSSAQTHLLWAACALMV